jgi:hypothetical protein
MFVKAQPQSTSSINLLGLLSLQQQALQIQNFLGFGSSSHQQAVHNYKLCIQTQRQPARCFSSKVSFSSQALFLLYQHLKLHPVSFLHHYAIGKVLTMASKQCSSWKNRAAGCRRGSWQSLVSTRQQQPCCGRRSWKSLVPTGQQ